MYYVIDIDSPREAIRVCRNSRVADVVVASMNAYEGRRKYAVSEGPIDRVINRVVSDFGVPAEQVLGRLS